MGCKVQSAISGGGKIEISNGYIEDNIFSLSDDIEKNTFITLQKPITTSYNDSVYFQDILFVSQNELYAVGAAKSTSHNSYCFRLVYDLVTGKFEAKQSLSLGSIESSEDSYFLKRVSSNEFAVIQMANSKIMVHHMNVKSDGSIENNYSFTMTGSNYLGQKQLVYGATQRHFIGLSNSQWSGAGYPLCLTYFKINPTECTCIYSTKGDNSYCESPTKHDGIRFATNSSNVPVIFNPYGDIPTTTLYMFSYYFYGLGGYDILTRDVINQFRITLGDNSIKLNYFTGDNVSLNVMNNGGNGWGISHEYKVLYGDYVGNDYYFIVVNGMYNKLLMCKILSGETRIREVSYMSISSYFSNSYLSIIYYGGYIYMLNGAKLTKVSFNFETGEFTVFSTISNVDSNGNSLSLFTIYVCEDKLCATLSSSPFYMCIFKGEYWEKTDLKLFSQYAVVKKYGSAYTAVYPYTIRMGSVSNSLPYRNETKFAILPKDKFSISGVSITDITKTSQGKAIIFKE